MRRNGPKFPPAGWRYRRAARHVRAGLSGAAGHRARPNWRRRRDAGGTGGHASRATCSPPTRISTAMTSRPILYGAASAEAQDIRSDARSSPPGVDPGHRHLQSAHEDENGEVRDFFFCRPGDDVQITFPNGRQPAEAVNDDVHGRRFVRKQDERIRLRASPSCRWRRAGSARHDRSRNREREYVTSIQIKLKPGADLNAVRDRAAGRFPIGEYPYRIQTWRDMQGPLLAAVQMETTILNILLFLIIAVAGFGILATFFMIVVEKTRDIGDLKALGAPSRGVMSIFLSYGFSLGLVGSGVGHGAGTAVRRATSTKSRRVWSGSPADRSVRSDRLLLPRDSHDRRAAHGDGCRGGRGFDRGAGQRAAGAACRTTSSGGGIAL